MVMMNHGCNEQKGALWKAIKKAASDAVSVCHKIPL